MKRTRPLKNSFVWTALQVLNQDETPLLYSLVFGEGVVNDATSVVLFNAIQSFDLTRLNSKVGFQFIGSFLYLFAASTFLGVFVSHSWLCYLYNVIVYTFRYITWNHFFRSRADWAAQCLRYQKALFWQVLFKLLINSFFNPIWGQMLPLFFSHFLNHTRLFCTDTPQIVRLL